MSQRQGPITVDCGSVEARNRLHRAASRSNLSSEALVRMLIQLAVARSEAAALRAAPGESVPILDLVVGAQETRSCVICGCTDDRACRVLGVPCTWVGPRLCSACAPLHTVAASPQGLAWLRAVQQGPEYVGR